MKITFRRTTSFSSVLSASEPTSGQNREPTPTDNIVGKRSRAEPMSLETHPSTSDRDIRLRNVAKVSYDRKLRRITLQRFVCSKLVHRKHEVSFEEILVLYDNMLWCQDKASQDPLFLKKFGEALSKLSNILKGTRFSRRNFSQSLPHLARRIKEDLEHFLLPERNLVGVARYLRGKYHIRPFEQPGTLRRHLPKERYIGVGYKDKGTARDPAYDGSPRWQDVAMNRRNGNDSEA